MKNEDSNNIIVQLLRINGNVELYDDVKYIKIKSKKYNLIIMKDYLPIIGEIEGKIEVGRAGESIKLNSVRGYFMHKHNKFNLFYAD